MGKHIVFDCDGTLLDTHQIKYMLYPGVKELLSQLADLDCALYVWTARDRKSTVRFLKEEGVLHLFDTLCTVEDALPKPHISGLVDMLGDIPKSKICVIGDTSNDILGAKNFGVKSIGVTWNTMVNPEVLKEAGADFITTDPNLVLNWIRENLN